MKVIRVGVAGAALAMLTVRECLRQQLWLVFVLVGGVLGIALLRLTAVDESARMKLAVVVICGAFGFVATMLGMLIAAGQLRRDLDGRVSVMLFSKPLPFIVYLLGRLAGVLLILLVGLTTLACLSDALVACRFGYTPHMREVVGADDWRELSSLGESLPVRSGQERLVLGGPAGNGARFHVLVGPGIGSREVLLRVDARSRDPGSPTEHLHVQVLASPDRTSWHALQVADDSPYGRDTASSAGEGSTSSRIQMRARDAAHADLATDYCHLVLPPSGISPSGETWIQVIRLDADSALEIEHSQSVLIAVPGGGFLANLLRACLILLAQAALLCTFTLLVATVSNLAVALLGGLTLYFAGNALWALRETLLFGDPGRVVGRLVHIGLRVLPDFDRGVSAQLAAGHAVTWSSVTMAWSSFGLYTLLFLLGAWVALWRREL